jgi:SAM-dependent methyltransferase
MDGTGRLACPRCRSSLAEPRDGDAWSCDGCGATFPGLRGIPDLRTSDDVFLANRDDWAFARRLDEDFGRLDFRGLLDRYYDLSPEVPADLRRRQVAHILGAPARARAWLDALGPMAGGPLLDLGCGTGSFLAAVGAGMPGAWGIDIAMRWLLVARKRLDEEGLGHIRLACGCAERLPFRDRTFAGVVAGDVIEHVGDQAATLAEAHRVLSPEGRIFLASPNRFSLAPEPHVQVWCVGYLPRRWMPGYVRWRRQVDFRAIRTLGYVEWRRLLRRSPFAEARVSVPSLPESDLAHFGPFKRRAARAYNAAVATRAGRALALAVGPLFHVVCRRDNAPTPPASRSTRRRSRPTGVPG